MKKRVLCIFLLCSVIMSILGGCRKSDQGNFSTEDEQEQTGAELAFSVEDYRQRFLKDRIAVSEYRGCYEAETDEVRKKEYQNLHFETCEFAEFPDVEQLDAMVGVSRDFSPQEAFEMIEDWLESVGKQDGVGGLKTQIRTTALEPDDNDDWPLLYEHMTELESGAGAYIDGKGYHLQTLTGGFYSMSNGTISEYLGNGYEAIDDALGDSSNDVVETGTLSELGDKKYELISGELSVKEGAEMTEEYFMSGTPFAPQEGITIDVFAVNIFKLKDVYGYDYRVRRKYHSVPFASSDLGRFSPSGNCFVEGDRKNAYVVDDSGVSAFSGYNDSEKLISLVTEDKMAGLEKSVEILSENLASMLNVQVDTVGLVYAPVTSELSENPQERMIYPCWEFAGVNRVKNEGIRIYMDVFTGDVYYYTFEIQE